jgi:ribosome-binding factor A
MANLRRIERANELLREIIGDFLVHRLRDPRLQLVTVTEVQLSPDFQHGKVYFTVLGGEQREQEALAALQSAEPLIREEINRNVHWRFIPRLTFIVDKRIEKAMSVLALLDQIAQSQSVQAAEGASPEKPTKKRTRRTSKSRS